MAKNARSGKHAARKFAVVDSETTSFKHGRIPKVYLWGYYDGEVYREFTDTAEFASFIGAQRQIIYAHNGGKFDYHFLLPFLNTNTEIMVIDGRLVKADLGLAELRDSYNILPVPLRAYKKDDFDYSVLEDHLWEQNYEAISKYLKADCLYLHEIITTQREDYGTHLTLAGSAMDFWAKRFGGDKPNTPRWLFDKIEPFYYGGRVECFEKGIIEREFQVYDINSAYPYAMLHKHPWGTLFTVGKTVPENYGLCFVRCIGISKGAFPYREKNKSLSFPQDDVEREYYVTGWEWQTAKELNLFKGELVEVITFKESITFTDYVNHFFKLKADMKGKDEARYLLAKLYMNSLYGKFGQNSEDHKDYKLGETTEVLQHVEEGYNFCGELGPHALFNKPVPPEKQRYFNLATAASITGFVRAYLLRHIHAAEKVLYCDTDSLACIGFKGAIGKALGEWAHEGDFSEGAIGGKKLYAFHYQGENRYKIATKGARLTEKEIYAVARGEKVIYKNDAPTFNLTKEPNFVVREIKMT